MTRPALAILLALVGLPAVAHADRPASAGPYAELGFGATGFLGTAAEYGALGPSAALRVGYDVFSFLSLGGRLELDSHQATVPPPPGGQYFQLYHAAVEVRLAARVGALGLFAEGGLGAALVSTNILAKVALTEPDETLSPVVSAGGGLEYQLMNRHYALGLAGLWSLLPGFESTQAVSGRAYLRYTY